MQQKQDLHIVNSIRLIALQDIVRQISTDCMLIIELLDQLENAIMFARLQTTHPSVIKRNEIIEMLTILERNYENENVIKVKSVLSYYQLLISQVFFENNRIIFTINFPISPTITSYIK